MPASRPAETTSASKRKVSREAEREGKVQDIIDTVKALMAEDADGNEEQAKKVLLKAHRPAKEARHWGDIAKCWFHYFLDLERSEACFLKALEIASTEPRVATVAYRIKEVDDQGKVIRHVIGHRLVDTGVYLHTLIAATTCVRGKLREQKRVMRRGEEEADRVRSSMRAFDQFDEDTLRFFDKAESQLAWLHVARCWWEDFDERRQALRCLARAEELATEMNTIPNWVEVAKVWMRVMREPGEARRCVAEAEKHMEKHTAQEYIMLAEGVAVLGDPELPSQYLDKAESLINELSDWSAIAYTWEELGYLDRAERANNIWEYLHEKTDMDDYGVNGGYGRYVPGEGPY